MEIQLNGTAHQLPDAQLLSELIASMQLTQQAIAVAVNRQIVPRPAWATRTLQAADQVDIVRAIGGG
jgi:sulfur carrier protein